MKRWGRSPILKIFNKGNKKISELVKAVKTEALHQQM